MKIPNLNQDPTGQTWLLQTALNTLGYGLVVDNWPGPKTTKALTQFKNSLEPDGTWDKVKASSFADLKDVEAFKKCKKQGKTDNQCFKVGDNGIGYWGHNTAQETLPMCALPREIWSKAGKSGGSKVEVRYKGKTASGILADTMPSLANIKNGAGIDLNPAFAKAFGLKPPFLVSDVEWRWV